MSFRFQVYARETKNVQFGKRFQKFAFVVTVLIRYIVEVKNLNLLRYFFLLFQVYRQLLVKLL